MLRIAAALLVAAFATTTTAHADALEMKASLKQKGSKIVIRLEVPAAVRTALKSKRKKVKVNVYAGKNEGSTKRVKTYRWAFKKNVRKWSFDKKELCKKGHRHVRIKVKTQSKSGEDELKRTLDLDC